MTAPELPAAKTDDLPEKTDDLCAGIKRLRISWSQVKTTEECKQKAHLQRRQRRNPAGNIRVFFPGTLCDRIMREWLSEPDPTPGDMPARVEPYMTRLADEAAATGEGVVRWFSASDRAETIVRCRAALERLEPMLVKWVLPYEYQPEYRFSRPITVPYLDGTPTEIDLIGGMDILVRRSRDPIEMFAYDLKISTNAEYLRSTLGQGVFYDLVTVAEFGAPLRQFGFFAPAAEPPDPQVLPLNVTTAMRADLMARIVRVAHIRWRGDTAPKTDHEGCSRCGVRHGCVKFSPAASAFAPVRSARR